MSLKVLFIAPDYRPDLHIHNGSIFEGIGYLSAFLKQAGHAVEFFGPKNDLEAQELIGVIARANPQLIGFSCVSSSYKYVKKFAHQTKKHFPDIPIICGGVHPTIAPEEVIACPDIDLIAVGEAEHSLLETVGRLEAASGLNDVKGIWHKKNGVVVRNEPAELPDYDQYPFPDLDLFKVENTFYYRNRFGVLKLSRGCPYSCTYCCNPTVQSCYSSRSKYVRFRSPQNSIKFITEYLKRYPNIDVIAFLDDILFLKKDWFSEFASLYKKEINLPFACRGRVNLFDDDTASRLKDANCYEITFGVESGDRYIRNELLNREMTDEQIIRAFQTAKRHGITTRVNNMIGLPYETVSTVFATIALNAQLDYKYSLNSIFTPFKGSELFDLCEKNKWLGTEDLPDAPYRTNSTLRLPGISSLQIRYFAKWFDLLVLLHKKWPAGGNMFRKLHNNRFFPYRLMNALHAIGQAAQKMIFCLKTLLGLGVKRYQAR